LVEAVELFAFSIPFRDLAPLVDDWRERTCMAKPSHGVPPHVTLLIPAPPDMGAAEAALTEFSPFDVTFRQLDRFPGTLWLAPEPTTPFVAMTEALVRQFPDHPPYEGMFETVTPHLTVAQGEDLDEAAAALTKRLPLRSRASSVVLFEQVAPERWREAAELPL
jgi:2'-5' RNA ligase